MAVLRIVLRRPLHPLSSADGRVHRDRLVLWEKIGPGHHPCHWCGRDLQWYSKIRPWSKPDYLVADHLDRNCRNDTPENLVPACYQCNLYRDITPNPFKAEISAMPKKRGSRENAYRRVSYPDHPLADGQGCVRVHRLVLYAKIGPGEHPCHWCGRTVSWDVGARSLEPRMLVPDHLDGVKTNNDPDNLVPACTPCNVMRGRSDRVLDHEVYVMDGTTRQRAEKRTCEKCGNEFLAMKVSINNGGGRFCSQSCSWSAMLAEKHGHTKDTLFVTNSQGKNCKAEKRTCKFCKEEFLFPVAMTTHAPGNYCSRRCAIFANKANGKMCGRKKTIRTSDSDHHE